MKTRVLDPSEWDRIDWIQAQWYRTMKAEDVAVVVVEDEGRILARMTVLRAPHLENYWIDPEYSGNPGVTRALLRAATMQAQEWAPMWAYVNADNDDTRETLERLGGHRIPMLMDTYVFPVEVSLCRGVSTTLPQGCKSSLSERIMGTWPVHREVQ